MLKLRTKAVALVAGGLVIVGAGGAYAYWTTNGSGSGSASTAAGAGSLVLHASFDAGLTPGATGTVAYTADNPGTSSLFLTTITPTVSIDAAHAGCSAADFTATPVTANIRVMAGAAGVAAGTGSISFADTAANQDACKGAIVTLALSSN